MPADVRAMERAGLGLSEVPGEGRCLTACRDFPAGAVLLSERPVVRSSSEEAAREIAREPRRFELLRGKENLAAAHVAGSEQPYLLEAETNSFIFGGKCVLFHIFAMLNHACATSKEENVCFSVLNTGEQAIDDELEIKLVTTRSVSAGEPLHISYHELFADPESKAARILAHCGGACHCSICRLAGGERDVRQIARVLDHPAVCQHCGGEGLRVSEGDLVCLQGLPDAQYNGLHARLLQVCGDGRCLVFALFQGAEKQLKLKREHLAPLERAAPGLQKCSRCRSVSFCSRECQREGWKDHKRFCSSTQETWEGDHKAFSELRRRFDSPDARQSASEEDCLGAFSEGERFVQKWTQRGRSRRLASGHQAVQDALLFLIPLGTMLLWRRLEKGQGDGQLWLRVAELASIHLQHVRSVVPRFHIAHWTALHHVRGLLSLLELQAADSSAVAKRSEALSAEFERQLDVARVYDPSAAENFKRDAGGGGGSLGGGMKLFQDLAQDSAKLEEFYSIDPSMPMDQKLEVMAKLLSSAPAAKQKPAPRQPVPSRGPELLTRAPEPRAPEPRAPEPRARQPLIQEVETRLAPALEPEPPRSAPAPEPAAPRAPEPAPRPAPPPAQAPRQAPQPVQQPAPERAQRPAPEPAPRPAPEPAPAPAPIEAVGGSSGGPAPPEREAAVGQASEEAGLNEMD